jgi:hypothetical protein
MKRQDREKIMIDNKKFSKCQMHGWEFETDDPFGCPVCYGITIERDRIISVFYAKEASRTIIEVLASPHTAEELEQTIIEGQER